MNRRSFLKRITAVAGIALLAPTELIPAIETSIEKTNPLFTGQLGVYNGFILHTRQIEDIKNNLEKNDIKPIEINNKKYYVMFAHDNSYKMLA